MELTATVTGLDQLTAYLAQARGQLPFAQSLALNRVANTIQRAIRQSLASHFTLRQSQFMERTIYRRPGIWPNGDNAHKTSLTAAVRINPARDFLAKFEEGGTKQRQGGGQLLLPSLRLGNPMLIIKRSDPLHQSKLPGALMRSGKVRTKGVKGTTGVFLRQTADGRRFIVQRTGPQPTDTRLLYTFRTAVAIAPRLGFLDRAGATFEGAWAEEYSAALDRALATAR